MALAICSPPQRISQSKIYSPSPSLTLCLAVVITRSPTFRLAREISRFRTPSKNPSLASPSFEHLAQKTGNTKAQVLADTLDAATEKLLLNDKSPKRKAGELDNRGSHFYLTLYWAQELAAQDKDAELKAAFAPLAAALTADEAKIVEELSAVQGKAVDIGGYYAANPEKAAQAMRPSATFNQALSAL